MEETGENPGCEDCRDDAIDAKSELTIDAKTFPIKIETTTTKPRNYKKDGNEEQSEDTSWEATKTTLKRPSPC